jgi:hypothetical protein
MVFRSWEEIRCRVGVQSFAWNHLSQIEGLHSVPMDDGFAVIPRPRTSIRRDENMEKTGASKCPPRLS